MYIVLFLLLGLLLVRLIRGNKDRKHMYVVQTVIVKLFIRLSGAVLVYQASSSPLGSMLLITLLSLSYIILSIHLLMGYCETSDEEDS